uniref:protein FAR1-RELATED SEQUENCE 5-like n=1 Tax=Erigeron canadensis TaxID=72917 RepID=UPI001CB90DEC|nr:protein FAR1-RELATED SEQUENCE 5-like [Erigeron canadensis]
MDDRIGGLIKKTLKCQCPFRLIGRLTDDGWRITVVDDTHNHYPAENLEGYAYARRLTEEERLFLEEEYHRGSTPRRMLKLLKEKFPGNLTRSDDIYNFQKAMRKKAAEKHGNTPMQVMFSLLKEHNYLYYHTTNSVSGRLENLFFIHPTSFKLWRAFPYVIQIDATYKTNMYNMPLVEIVGVTPTNRTFSISYAFIISEQEHNYR